MGAAEKAASILEDEFLHQEEETMTVQHEPRQGIQQLQGKMAENQWDTLPGDPALSHCPVGQSVQALWYGGHANQFYPATIASINGPPSADRVPYIHYVTGSTVTVNWDDGDSRLREIRQADISKDGKPCEFCKGAGQSCGS